MTKPVFDSVELCDVKMIRTVETPLIAKVRPNGGLHSERSGKDDSSSTPFTSTLSPRQSMSRLSTERISSYPDVTLICHKHLSFGLYGRG